EVERLADFLVLMDQGRIVASGAINEILADVRLPITRAPDAAAVVEGFVIDFDAQYGLTHVDVDGETMLVPGRIQGKGKAHRIRVAAADVSLAVDRPSRTSILNVLPVRIRDIHEVDAAQVNIVVSIGHRQGGTKLIARISKQAFEKLGLSLAQDVYAQVK